ncbi:3,4-dihydroxy-2-butanone-4-phosphate synthase RibB [methanogenic archaeon mixed culture ISO4-G1]|nr:3,4-dihydroxy-2-butanone-4-phosphate synthase RibB [methanogenic archaeon mixed culture ISO4-G1]
MEFESILEDIRKGKPILVYDFDDRERECDMTVASEFVTPEIIQMMRKDAGGLICVTTPYSLAKELGLPFMSDVYWDDCEKYPLLKAMAPTDIPYDRTRSSFGVTINHRKTYTGITDKDRALTASEYAKILFSGKSTDEIKAELGENFRAPGHIHLLNTSERILESRFGHTELCTALMYMAGVKPSATICEMMGDDFGSRSKSSVKEYADPKGIKIIDGNEVIAQWKEFKKDHPEL